MSNTYDEFVNRVVEAVRKSYGSQKWFRGVCLDGVRDFYPNQFEKAVEHAENQTFYWDGMWGDYPQGLEY